MDMRTASGALAYYADGYRGNYLVIMPDARLVAVRTKGPGNNFDPVRDTFSGFVQQVAELCR